MINRIQKAIQRRKDPVFRRMEERAKEYTWVGFSLEPGPIISSVHSTTYGSIQLRNNSSDFQVFEQVFYRGEYEGLYLAAIDNQIRPEIIVDAGANIGLASIYFLQKFPGAQVFAIEPMPENIASIKINLPDAVYENRFRLFKGALWKSGALLSVDYTFGDGKEWSRAVKENGETGSFIKGATIETLMAQWNIPHIDILKIDIEGAEAVIFENSEACRFLTNVKLIAIEIHDHSEGRRAIVDILKSYGFIIFQSGEATIGFNSRFTSSNSCVE